MFVIGPWYMGTKVLIMVTGNIRGGQGDSLLGFAVELVLQKKVQSAKDSYLELVGGDRVHVIKKGGDQLIHFLGHNDPWATKRMYSDKSSVTC